MVVNGESMSLSELKDPNIETLLAIYQLSKERVAIELNGKFIKRESYPSITFSEEDVVELVHFVGGGL